MVTNEYRGTGVIVDTARVARLRAQSVGWAKIAAQRWSGGTQSRAAYSPESRQDGCPLREKGRKFVASSPGFPRSEVAPLADRCAVHVRSAGRIRTNRTRLVGEETTLAGRAPVDRVSRDRVGRNFPAAAPPLWPRQGGWTTP